MRQPVEGRAEAAAGQAESGTSRCQECGTTCGEELESDGQLSCTTCQQRVLAEFNPGTIRFHALERMVAREIN